MTCTISTTVKFLASVNFCASSQQGINFFILSNQFWASFEQRVKKDVSTTHYKFKNYVLQNDHLLYMMFLCSVLEPYQTKRVIKLQAELKQNKLNLTNVNIKVTKSGKKNCRFKFEILLFHNKNSEYILLNILLNSHFHLYYASATDCN